MLKTLLSVFYFSVYIFSATLMAQPETEGTPLDSEASQKNFGIGVMLGEPTGVTAKYFTSDRSAIDGTVSWSLGDKPKTIRLMGSYLYHTALSEFLNNDFRNMHVYYGLGLKTWMRKETLGLNEENFELGVRVPLGLRYLFNFLPLELFVEGAPIMKIVPNAKLNIDLAFGARYFF